MGKRFWFSFVMLSILIVLVAYLRQSNSQPAQSIRKSLQSVVDNAKIPATPTPYPFEDLTVPYLRQQTYASQLEDLNQIAQNINYTSYETSYVSQGLKINGILTVPTGKPPDGGWPAIVFVHGYIPPKQYNRQQDYVAYVDELAKSGFVIFKIDLRGNEDSQGDPSGAYYSSGYVTDTLNAYAALQVNAFATPSAIPSPTSVTRNSTVSVQPSVVINPNKIGLFGHSMAGNIVMRAWAVKPDIPVVVIWSGAGYTYEDLAKYKLHDTSYQPISSDSAALRSRQKIIKLYGDPDLKKSFWHDIAPVSYLSDLKGAIQIDQAQDDTVVSIDYNRDLMKLFDKTSVPHVMYEYPTGGHNITGVSFNQAMQHTVEFYKKYLE